MADLTYSININTRQALGGIKQLQQQLNKTDKAVKKVDKSAKGFGSSLGGLKTILAGVVSGAALKGIIDTTARFEDLRTTLGSVFGSAQKGAQAFEAIQNLSTKTQFGIEDLSNTFIKLAGAGIQPTEKLLQTFTDTAAVTTDQVGTLNAMTDLLSRTTQGGLGLEELNRLGDRGIPVFEILAEKLGITRNEISEFGKSAEGARKITEALAEGLDERFGGATADRLGNISTLMSNFSIAVKNAAGQVGEAMKPALSSLILTVTEFIEKNKDLAETIGTVLGSALNGVQFLLQLMADNAKLVGSAVVGLTAALGAKGLASALTAATAGFNLLKNAMKTNPFGLLAIGIATLIAYLSFENGLGRTFVQIKAAVDVLGTAFGRFTSFLADKVGGVVTWLKDRFFDFIQVLIDSYNAIARIIPGLDQVTSSARDFGDVVSAGVGDALDYAAGKAGEMKDAIVAAIPPEVLEQYEDLKTAVREAGETYDELKEKSKQAGETVAGVTQIPEIKAGGVVIDKKQSKEEIANAKKLENSMKGLTDRLLPLKAAKEKYKQETELLNKALLEGKITTTEFGIAMTNLNKEYQDFLDSNSEGTKTWMDGWREATDEYVKRARDASSNAKELFTTATQGMEDAIVGFVKTGKLSFRSLLSDIAEQLLRSQIRQLLANTFGGGGSSPSIFGIKIPGFANGGFLPAGQVGIVGEKGPEFITGPANITPMGGSMGNVTYNINAVDAPSFQSLVARDPGFIHAVAMQGARSL
jgi:plasmid maintenance system antidote protein VapI